MVIVMKPTATIEMIQKIKNKMMSLGCGVSVVQGSDYCILGLVGDTRKINKSQIEANEFVDKVLIVQSPFKMALIL